MAKFKMREKTKTVLDYLARFPDTSPKDLAERIRTETPFDKVTNDEVSKIKSAYRAQLKGQTQPEPGREATPTPMPATEAAQPAPADNGSPRRQPGVAETVRLVHRLLAGLGPQAARDVIALVAAMGSDETYRLIDLLQEIDKNPEGAKGSKP